MSPRVRTGFALQSTLPHPYVTPPMTRILLAFLLFPTGAIAAPPSVTAVAYDPHNDIVAFGTHGEVRLFGSAKSDARGVAKVRGRVSAMAFGQKGKWLAVASGEPGKEGVVQLFFISERMNGLSSLSPEKPIEFIAHKDWIYTLAFSPDGSTLATGGYDRLIHLWQVPENGEVAKTPRLTLKDHSDTVYALSFNHDGTLLASGSADRSVKVWEADTGKRLYTLSDSADWVYCLAWSPNGKHLAAGGVDLSIRVWEVNAEAGKLIGSAFAHVKPVWRLAYSADGRTLFSAGEDQSIKAWDAQKLTETKIYPPQPATILAFALRPDGKQMAIGRFDGAALLLNTETGKPVAQPLPIKPAPAPPAPKKIASAIVKQLTPDFGVRGQTARVIVTGSNLERITKVTTDSKHVTPAIAAGMRETDRLMLDVAIASDASIGAVQLTFEATEGAAVTMPFAVDRFPAISETGLAESARIAQVVTLPVTIAGALDRAGDADFFRFDAKTNQEIGVQATTTELGSKLDGVVVLTDEKGNVLAEGDRTLGFVIPKNGKYSIGIRDRDYNGGADFKYRLHIGNIPVITGVFPLAVSRGRTTEVHLAGVNLGTTGGLTIPVAVPSDAAIGSRLQVPISNIGERPVGKVELTITDSRSVVVDPITGADLRVPSSADGILSRPDEQQTIRFPARKGEEIVVEVLASRAGSPIDPVIEILDSSGKPVTRATLRSTAKTYSVFRDHDSDKPGIRIETWNDLAIDDYVYANGELMRILALPRNPDDDCQFYQVKGKRMGHLGTTPGHHAIATPMYKVEIHGAGKSFPPNGLPVFPIYYRNDDGGAAYDKDSYLLFVAPSDGTYTVRISDARGASGPTYAYHLTVRRPKPDFTVSSTPTAPAIWKGGGVPINVTVDRIDGFEGEVRVRLEGLPAGYSAPETFVEAGQLTTAFTLSAVADAQPTTDANILLVALATIGGKNVEHRVPFGPLKLASVGDIVTRTLVSDVPIRPGAEARFIVEIERQGKFAGRVPLEVRGLPHGVRVLNIGLNGILITERETRREVVLYAEPWVKPSEHPIVVYARREGANTEHAAKSVLLRVAR